MPKDCVFYVANRISSTYDFFSRICNILSKNDPSGLKTSVNIGLSDMENNITTHTSISQTILKA